MGDLSLKNSEVRIVNLTFLQHLSNVIFHLIEAPFAFFTIYGIVIVSGVDFCHITRQEASLSRLEEPSYEQRPCGCDSTDRAQTAGEQNFNHA